jgi:hypothetical protein
MSSDYLLGVLLAIVGFMLCVSVVGLPIGVPLMLVGMWLTMKTKKN